MIFFRADGNPRIGSGHIMRCLSIAREVLKKDSILFITSDKSFDSVIKGFGMENHILHTDYSDMTAELKQMQDLIQSYHPAVLFVDSYFVTFSYLNSLWQFCREVGCMLIYIDDVLEFAYPCDILLNYNIYGPGWRGCYEQLYEQDGLKEPLFLLGTAYVPLRPEFQRAASRIVKEKAENILVSTGGADSEHIAFKLVKEVVSRDLPYLFHFILGAMNADLFEIEKFVSDSRRDNIILHFNVRSMSALMQRCDLAISAAGSTLYELCATQTPALTYILADNQIPGADSFERHGILKCMGDFRNNETMTQKMINESISLAEDYERRSDMANKMRMVVDGNGCKRIWNVISEFRS